MTADTRKPQFWAIGVRVRAGGRVYDPQDPISVTPTWGVGRRVNSGAGEGNIKRRVLATPKQQTEAYGLVVRREGREGWGTADTSRMLVHVYVNVAGTLRLSPRPRRAVEVAELGERLLELGHRVDHLVGDRELHAVQVVVDLAEHDLRLLAQQPLDLVVESGESSTLGRPEASS